MSDKTGIEWTDATWNPIRGCSRVSEGCRHCYAERVAARFSGEGQPYAGLIHPKTKGWNGKVRFIESTLDQPLRWRRPRRIFVNSMSDLFHENLSDEVIDRVFAVMMLAQRHTFQVLTKRPERALEYLTTKWQPAPAQDVELLGRVLHIPAEKEGDTRRDIIVDTAFHILSELKLGQRDEFWMPDESAVHSHTAWPLPNVWLGTSVEDQAAADERIPLLLKTPASVRWISAEPLLGPIDLQYPESLYGPDGPRMCCDGRECGCMGQPIDPPLIYGLDWVVVGGESGPGARPMHPAWARSLRDQCAAAGVPMLFKQFGAWAPFDGPFIAGDIELDSDHLRRVGKKAAGRMLDGRLHDEFPRAA